MKIAIIGANGQAGNLIYQQAIARGHEVIAVVRNAAKMPADATVLERDVLNLSVNDLAGVDVVVSAISAFTPETLRLHSDSIRHLATILAGTSTRLLIVGGAGSLYLDASHQMQLKDAPDFPAEFAPLATAMSDGLTLLRTYSDINWTYVSPAADFIFEAEATGSYQLAGEIFTTNADGISQISYADYAIAMLDIIESQGYTRQRVSVLG